ncbi:SH3 domain-containing protein [Pseudoduganella namucuonensis]|uniref:SH3 domain-containing protein n=1 Tax=Pseudoduganella namucuonensis TaxID=1035707 RepID=A0A1I7GRH0_9BURK|nr:SH3 domain-containing protein [Pseudoduganella namucuonensis]SFU51009.1 SH3 domain-containing protein [Pseudoduganella namucuonensis]
MHTDSLYTAAAYLAGLAMTLALASWLTPRAWWRRPTARGLAILAGGTWGAGSLLLALARPTPPTSPAPPPEPTAPFVVAPMPTQPRTQLQAQPNARPHPQVGAGSAVNSAGKAASVAIVSEFRVHRALNLRAEPGVHAPRLGVVPAGATVTATGATDGDWWQIRTQAGGAERTGWASSLWLRRAAEAQH